jgi:hypothetical protein
VITGGDVFLAVLVHVGERRCVNRHIGIVDDARVLVPLDVVNVLLV